MSSNKKLFDFHYPVAIPSALFVIAFVTITLIVGEPIKDYFSHIQTLLYDNVGWFFVSIVNIMLFSSVLLILSPFGKIKLGGPKASTDFSDFAWYSMLFSAGMGIGLIFYGAAEPLQHFANPPIPVDSQVKAAEQAFKFTLLHYGFHPWAVYGIVALSFAFFTFNRKLPLSVRSLFAPLLGRRIHGVFGHTVDALAVVACLFGLSTTLGFGAQQVGSGLNYLFGLPNTTTTQVIFILIVTGLATISIVSGLDKGVRILSEFNVRLTLIFLVAMLIIGPTVFLLDSFIENFGLYLQNLIPLGSYTEVYSETQWQNNWTIFYWAWWISWSPFVGIFIARVSKGRTIKEFLLGVIIIPTVFSVFWFTIFGSSGLYLELHGIGDVTTAVKNDISTALFEMLGHYPLSKIMSFIGIILIISFFVTSSDSGSLVVDYLTSGGKLDTPVGQKVFWASMEGILACTLLIGGGLATLQTAVMIAALPFGIILVLMLFSLYKGLQRERFRSLRRRVRRNQKSTSATIGQHIDDYMDDSEENRED